MVNSSNLKRGIILEIDGAPWLVIEVAFQAPSARGASTITKAKVKNLITGAVLKKSYRGGEMLQEADCEKRDVQFLYRDGSEFHFMDEETYDQFSLEEEAIADSVGYMLDGMRLRSMLYNGDVVSIELPNTVELEVVETTPNLKGATAQAQLKPATLETGLVVQVPPYLESGVKIKVDTRDGRFIERVK
ncbi:MAG: elongation factor P [Deltaproteobacteria bacterium]|nr:elongation factor P [Deltaproteobacteria bacterium]MBN2672186.1 elongation factor P [Deltaproteobacteria bacterium]